MAADGDVLGDGVEGSADTRGSDVPVHDAMSRTVTIAVRCLVFTRASRTALPRMTDVRSQVLVRVTSDPLSADEALAWVADDGAGGTCLFVGTVRDHSKAGDVTGLRYEAWDELADKRLLEIAGELFEKWPIRKVAILHRTGDLTVGEASVVIACSAPHRGDAFDACRQGIERLKEDVPIWKKEALVSGDAHWVMGS
jgi:molybdopterin synthase catalytic subunit